MQFKSKLALAGAGLLSLGGVGVGMTLAATGAAAAPAHTVRVVNAAQVTPAGPAVKAPVTPSADPDNVDVQSGDQTTPDVPGATEADTAKAGTAKAGTTEVTTPETDGPGGNTDPAGNVDHQSTTEQ